jgi:C-terminal processing protease CtpA/Prc
MKNLLINLFLVVAVAVPFVPLSKANSTNGPQEKYAAIIERIAEAVEAQYPIETKGRDIAASIRHAGTETDLISAADTDTFVEALNAVLWDAAHDLHLKVHTDAALQKRSKATGSRVPRMRRVEVTGSELELEVGQTERALGTTKIAAEMLDDNTGLITISSGIYNNPGLFTDTLAKLSAADNVIIDLRHAPGGTRPGVRYFLSQFYAEPTHLVSFVERNFDEPQEMWSLNTSVSNEFAKKNLYVLTSRRTGSGAEAVSFALKETERATLIGEKTAGAGNAGAMLGVGSGLSLFLPISQTISATSGEAWEGSGVKPHVATLADEALQSALASIDAGLSSNDTNQPQSDLTLAEER